MWLDCNITSKTALVSEEQVDWCWVWRMRCPCFGSLLPKMIDLDPIYTTLMAYSSSCTYEQPIHFIWLLFFWTGWPMAFCRLTNQKNINFEIRHSLINRISWNLDICLIIYNGHSLDIKPANTCRLALMFISLVSTGPLISVKRKKRLEEV